MRNKQQITPIENDSQIQDRKNAELGLRIRRERILWSMTQEDLSQILGISPNYLGQIERGNRSISRKMEDRLCEVFHMTHDEFHSRPAPSAVWSSRVAESAMIFQDLHEEDLIRLLQGCTPQELQVCGHLIRSMLYFMRKGRPAVVPSPDPRTPDDAGKTAAMAANMAAAIVKLQN